MTDLDPLARAILEAGREGDDPTPDERARVRGALLSAIAAPGGGSGPQGHSAVGHGTAAATKTVAVAVGKLAAVGVAVWLGSSVLLHFWPQTKESTPTSSAPAALQHAPAPAPGPAPVPVRAVSPSPAPRSSREVRSGPAQQSGAVTGNVARAPRSPSPAAAPPGPASVPPPSATARFAQVPSAAPAGDTLAAETRELRSAYAAMERGDPARALALLDQQSAEYPHGQLGQERAAARVFALCKLGRTAEAHAAAARFLAQNPGSPLAGRVRKACAAH